MNKVKNVGLIQYKDLATSYELERNNESKDFNIKKILVKNKALATDYYPDAEIVQDTHSIIHDSSIDLVIVFSPDDEGMDIVAEALNAGKNVRVM